MPDPLNDQPTDRPEHGAHGAERNDHGPSDAGVGDGVGGNLARALRPSESRAVPIPADVDPDAARPCGDTKVHAAHTWWNGWWCAGADEHGLRPIRRPAIVDEPFLSRLCRDGECCRCHAVDCIHLCHPAPFERAVGAGTYDQPAGEVPAADPDALTPFVRRRIPECPWVGPHRPHHWFAHHEDDGPYRFACPGKPGDQQADDVRVAVVRQGDLDEIRRRAADRNAARRDADAARKALRTLARAAGRVLEDWAESSQARRIELRKRLFDAVDAAYGVLNGDPSATPPARAAGADEVRAQIEDALDGVLAPPDGEPTALDAGDRRELAAAVMDRVVEPILRERDLAIAHDRQPYPTAEAYERACAALEKHRARADTAESDRDAARADAAALRRQLGEIQRIAPYLCGRHPEYRTDCAGCVARAAVVKIIDGADGREALHAQPRTAVVLDDGPHEVLPGGFLAEELITGEGR